MIEPMQKTWGIGDQSGDATDGSRECEDEQAERPGGEERHERHKYDNGCCEAVLSIPSMNCAMPERTKVRT